MMRLMGEQVEQMAEHRTMLKRMAAAEIAEIAEVVAFLAGPAPATSPERSSRPTAA
jgi:hypothetical protein